jgi:hypothetical protein
MHLEIAEACKLCMIESQEQSEMDRKACMAYNSNEPMLLGYSGFPFIREKRIFIKSLDKGTMT